MKKIARNSIEAGGRARIFAKQILCLELHKKIEKKRFKKLKKMQRKQKVRKTKKDV